MITKEVWEDKLPIDKVKYYNRTRMSIELFSVKTTRQTGGLHEPYKGMILAVSKDTLKGLPTA